MKHVFFVLNGESQHYFIKEDNATNHANKKGGEIFQEEISNKKFDDLKKKKGFFLDLPEMEIVKEEKKELPKKPDDLKALVEKLQEENNQLRKVQKLNYEDAAALFKKKGELLGQIGKFESIEKKLNEIELKPTEKDELSTDKYRIVLQNTYYHSKDEIFAVSNILIIAEFLEFIKTKIQNKVECLKTEVQEL